MVSPATLKDYLRVLGPFGLTEAIARRILGRPGLKQLRHESLLHPVRLRIPSTDVMVFKQVVIDDEYRFRGEPPIIIDAGANIGLSAVVFASKFEGSRIIAVEPEPNNFSLLEENCAPYDNITPIHAALWRSDGHACISDQGIGDWGFAVSESDERGHVVETVTVDTLMDRFGIEHVDLLKVDIEGGESELFENASEWIFRIGAIAIELHEHLRPSSSDTFLRAAGSFENRWTRGENAFVSRSNSPVKEYR